MEIDKRLSEIASSLYRVAVRAVIVHSGKVLLIQERAGPNEAWWGLPGGGIAYGEAPEDALQRVVAEQLDIGEHDVTCTGPIIRTIFGPVLNEIPRASLLYRADVPRNEVGKTEQIASRDWFTLEELGELRLSPSLGEKDSLLAVLTEQVAAAGSNQA